MRAVIWTRGEHCKNLGLAVCQYFGSQNSRHASQFALLWLVVCGRTRAKRGNGARRSDLAHGKLTHALVTEEQHPSWAQPKGFRWFSGPEDVLRVVLRVVLGSETWAWDGWSVVLRCITIVGFNLCCEATYLPGIGCRLGQMAEITFDLPATSNQLKA